MSLALLSESTSLDRFYYLAIPKRDTAEVYPLWTASFQNPFLYV
jgi:hypothetical protein